MKTLFLIGLVGIPTAALWIGHRLRFRSARLQGIFWGAIAGHSLAIVPTFWAAGVPPSQWEGGGARGLLILGSLAAGGMVGAAIGAALGWRPHGGRPRRAPRRPDARKAVADGPQ